MDTSRSAVGARLSAQVPRLRLVCAHFAGRAIRARVELDDLVQEVIVRALAHPGGLPARSGDHAASPGAQAECADRERADRDGALKGRDGHEAGACDMAEDVAEDRAEADIELARLLTVIARHTIIDLARGLRAQKRAGVLDEVRLSWSGTGGMRESRLAVRSSGPVSQLARAELRDDLVKSFLDLDPDHRRVIGLRQIEGLSAAETAKRMGRGEAAVHSLFRRALAAWESGLQACDQSGPA